MGNKLQPRIGINDIEAANTPAALVNNEGGKSLEEQKREGRLLNQAIIKYRIEKKDIVDSAYRSKLG